MTRDDKKHLLVDLLMARDMFNHSAKGRVLSDKENAQLRTIEARIKEVEQAKCDDEPHLKD